MMQYLTKALLAACWFMLLTFPVMGIKLNSVDQTVEWQFDRVILLGVAIFFLSMLWNWCFSRKARGIPLIRTTHQQGHAAAALFAAKGEELFRQKVLLFHISGGTTDLLLCDQVERIETLGTSTDLYAGQAVDRVGVKLGFGFPAGVEVSRLAALCGEPIKPKSSVKGMQCSLSGLENQCNALLAAGKSPDYVCKYCLLCVADTVVKMTKAAQKEYPGLPVVCAGGVMSSDIIRQWVQQRLPQVYFVPGLYSSDNAIGVSILAAREVGSWLK